LLLRSKVIFKEMAFAFTINKTYAQFLSGGI